jgi:ABC-type Zn uptake system ZnuABC Zn-binding protein ZnuA
MSKQKIVDNMPSGEKEMRKVFEEVTTNNVNAVVGHSNATRDMVRELENKINTLENNILNMQKIVEGFRGTLAKVLQKFVADGSV